MMFIELIATLAAGVVAAGVALMGGHLTRGRLPRWTAPVCAGLAMIGYSIWSEYSWANRTESGLPEGVVVVERITESRGWKPWTYLMPQVTRLSALDRAGLKDNPAAPDVRFGEVYLFARWQPTARVPQLFRCTAAPARADVTEAALGDPEAASWVPLAADDPLIRSACSGKGGHSDV